MKKRILLGICTCVLVCVGFVLSNASSSMITVSGHVWDTQENQALEGARIQVEGISSNYTFTDLSGRFSIDCPKGSTLTYSYSDGSDVYDNVSKTYNDSNFSESIILRSSSSSNPSQH